MESEGNRVRACAGKSHGFPIYGGHARADPSAGPELFRALLLFLGQGIQQLEVDWAELAGLPRVIRK